MYKLVSSSVLWLLMGSLLVGCPGGSPTPSPGDGGNDGDNGAAGTNPGNGDNAGSGDAGSGNGGGQTDSGTDPASGDNPPPGDAPGSDFAQEFSGNSQSAAPYRDTLTPDEAWHLLRRTVFSASDADIQRVVSGGLSATITGILTEEPTPQAVHDLAASYEEDVAERWLVYLIESPNPFHEHMALFWHDRFATGRSVATRNQERNLPVLHYEMLRANALGDYRTFLLQLTLDPLMLLWLDGGNSPKDNPNENYAREFWELFTLGRDVLYTEEDIVEGARAFTGITLIYPDDDSDPRPAFDFINHDETMKDIFPGRSTPGNYDYISVTDLTLAQPEAAEYVAENLFRFLVHDHPSPEVVQAFAQIFRDNNYQIAPLVRAILSSEAMFSEDARTGLISSPVQHYVSFARTLDMSIFSEESSSVTIPRLADDLRDSGMELLNPPGVEGWDEGTAWLQDQWVISRVNALGRFLEFGPDRHEDVPYHVLPNAVTWDQRESRRAIVQALGRVFHLELTREEEDIYIDVLDQNGHRAFHLIDPDDQPRQIFEVIRLMAMDERFMTR